jgi:mannose-6-phosphate isomerase
MKEGIFKLAGKVQHYEWGGPNFIPGLIGIPKESSKPYAEYWLGAHPGASSKIEIDGRWAELNKLIQQEPTTFIGENVYTKFGELPYLLKVLDVKDMLSIQVHPTKEGATKGFDAEEAAGIPINASHRNYKDKNHKPEVMVALSEFWLLHGFKKEDELQKVLNEISQFEFLLSVFENSGYRGLYKTVMELPQQRVDEILGPLVKDELAKKNELTKDKPGFWVNKLYPQKQEIKDIDRGIFSIYFFNIVNVHPGEAIFQAAGIPHAYLEGQNVELMANSDNVLRGGLTSKHIDVGELLKHTTFQGVVPNVMKGIMLNDSEKTYPCPVADFGISLLEVEEGKQYASKSSSAEIYLVVEGAVDVIGGNQQFKKGAAFFVLPHNDVSLKARSASMVYKAYVP